MVEFKSNNKQGINKELSKIYTKFQNEGILNVDYNEFSLKSYSKNTTLINKIKKELEKILSDFKFEKFTLKLKIRNDILRQEFQD